MLTPSKDWDNEWQEIPGPEAIMIGVVQNPKLLPLAGQAPLRNCQSSGTKIPSTRSSISSSRIPATGVAVFGMSQPDVTLALQAALGRHR